MGAKNVNGTFSGTGQSDAVLGGECAISLTFAGTATVDLEWSYDSSTWASVESYTASAKKYTGPGPALYWRLNCTAHTNDVTYWIEAQ